jgi:uncharacterized surface anchored protein
MTRTDVMASSRPRNVGAAPMGRGSSGVLRRLSIVPVVLVLALIVIAPSTAFAASETTTGYTQEPNKPKEEPKTETTPTTESSTPEPAKEVSPSTSTTPASSTSPSAEKASTLPFTGFDLRWSLGIGLLLLVSGFSIVTVQRRQRRSER